MTKSTTDTELYIDNIMVASLGSAIPNPLSGSPEFNVGQVHTTGEFWQGSIDDIKVFNIPLSAIEVNDLYSEGGWLFQADDSVKSLAEGARVV